MSTEIAEIPVAVETAIQEHADAWFRAANPAADMIAVQMRSDALRLAIARALQAARDEERERVIALLEHDAEELDTDNAADVQEGGNWSDRMKWEADALLFAAKHLRRPPEGGQPHE